MRLILPIVGPSLNDWYSGGHWRARKLLAEEWHNVVRIACREQGITAVGKYPIIISAQSCYMKKKPMDTSNTFPALKLAEDGLVRAGIIVDDSAAYVAGSVIQAPSFGNEKDCTIITLSLAGIACTVCGRR